MMHTQYIHNYLYDITIMKRSYSVEFREDGDTANRVRKGST